MNITEFLTSNITFAMSLGVFLAAGIIALTLHGENSLANARPTRAARIAQGAFATASILALVVLIAGGVLSIFA